MDSNLTIHLGLVGSEQEGAPPNPSHRLVVLEVVRGGGRRFVEVLERNRAPSRGGFKLFSEPRYVSRPISGAPDITHEFVGRVEHISHEHMFEVHYRLSVCVKEPRTLVERVDDDPVMKLQTKVRESVEPALRVLGWAELERSILKDGSTELSAAILNAGRRELDGYAGLYGLELRQVALFTRLSAEDRVPLQKGTELDNSLRVEEKQARADIRREQLGRSIEEERAKTESMRRKATRKEKLHDAMAEQVVAAATNVALKIETVDQARRVISGINQLHDQLLDPDTAQSASNRRPMAGASSLEAGEYPRLLAPGLEPQVVRVVTDIFERVSDMRCSAEMRRKVLSVLLHMVAEATLADRADASLVSRYRAEVETIALGDDVSPDLFQFLKSMTNLDVVAKRLGE